MEKLTIALEPEAASLFCRHLPVEKSLGRHKVSLAKFQAGKKYLVLDAGGKKLYYYQCYFCIGHIDLFILLM
jgi:hypothetical protein